MTARVPPRIWKSVDLWARKEDPDAWVFAARCSGVSELYSDALASGPPLRAWSSWARIVVDGTGRPEAPVEFTPRPTGRDGDMEAIHVQVPHEILSAPRSTWAELQLNWLHDLLSQVAALRGYDQAILDRARAQCIDRGIEMRAVSRTKRSPDRRHGAQLTFEIDPDGVRIVGLEIEDREGLVVGASTFTMGAPRYTLRDFRALARDWRWTSATRVQAGAELAARVGVTQGLPRANPADPASESGEGRSSSICPTA